MKNISAKKFYIIVAIIFGIFVCFSSLFGFIAKTNYREEFSRPINEWDKPNVDEGIEYKEMAPLPSIAPNNAENPYTNEKKILGNRLFNEPKLSKSKQISCASCHNKELGYGDALKTSYGHDRQRGNRNAPNISMSGFFDKLFWDGRADSLESQALGPIENPIEMAHNATLMQQEIAKISAYYPLFILAFGSENDKKSLLKLIKNANNNILDSKNYNDLYDEIIKRLNRSALLNENNYEILKNIKLSKNQIKIAQKLITKENITKAIATYERSLVPKNTRFNRFLNGDYKALSDEEIYGLYIFRTKGRCMNCHYGAMLSDGQFHNIGLSFYGRKLQDLGRYEITHNKNDLGAFKTPSLINISKSAPYMHNGIFPHLKGIINMYNAAFGKENRKNDVAPITPLIKPLNLSEEEKKALEAFLLTL